MKVKRMRYVVGERAKDKLAASVSQMGRFETEILTQPQNLKIRIFVQISGKLTVKMNFLDPAIGFLVKLSML